MVKNGLAGRFSGHVRSRRFFRSLGDGGRVNPPPMHRGPERAPFFGPEHPFFFAIARAISAACCGVRVALAVGPGMRPMGQDPRKFG